ncbi:MAG: hypothetical protein E6K80_05165 [Candidatus Eisenbacteria bacterium]|uniref:Uncharacterized protein n=1 Tax=Eiseniibacteriota bacterium TaxID=2212470 RepID=A0A538U6S3_UNCEI|nr:MAG: hypothetical protein E6K80_05165 [Candidatus Eisenbacteria bacterium]
MQKIHRCALPLFLLFAVFAFVSNADAKPWKKSSTIGVSDYSTTDPTGGTVLTDGDPDFPNRDKRLQISGPSDVTMPTGLRGWTWWGYARLFLNGSLRGWFAR